MISVEDARLKIISALKPVGHETVALANAHHRVLARPVLARLTQPPADVSAMDGYAIRASDGAAGSVLKVIGQAPAGHPFQHSLSAGESVRLFTGSIVPAGADTVIIQENVSLDNDRITIHEAIDAGKNIRRAGQDFALGDVLVEAGKMLGARDIGLVAAGNHPWVGVSRRPKIAILATGDEISLPGEAIGPGGIVSSNAHALAAFIYAVGGAPIILPIAKDDLATIGDGAEAARGADMLVTTGGASVGDHDLVRAGLAARGLTLNFWKIAMRPGKPLMFGGLAGMPMLGLPGNPVSAMVCALLFLKPAIERLSGMPGDAPSTETAKLSEPLKPNDQREDYVRATLQRNTSGWTVTPFAIQDSGMLKALAHADALIKRAPYDTGRQAGEAVEIIRLGETGL
jgi:molybdopterin molybdotransferase